MGGENVSDGRVLPRKSTGRSFRGRGAGWMYFHCRLHYCEEREIGVAYSDGVFFG